MTPQVVVLHPRCENLRVRFEMNVNERIGVSSDFCHEAVDGLGSLRILEEASGVVGVYAGLAGELRGERLLVSKAVTEGEGNTAKDDEVDGFAGSDGRTVSKSEAVRGEVTPG